MVVRLLPHASARTHANVRNLDPGSLAAVAASVAANESAMTL
jgi:hypothetical protein